MAAGSAQATEETVPLNQLPFLTGKQLTFASTAEMLVSRAAEIPDHNLVLFYEQTITYGQTNERANRVANYLKTKGVSKGDVVSILVGNSPEIYYTMFGAQKLGAIAGIVNFALKGPEIAYLLDDSKPKVIFVGSEFMADFAVGYGAAGHKPLVVEVKTGVEHGINLGQEQFAPILTSASAAEALTPQKLTDPFLLLYSSGTTGRPKGILLTNKSQFSICHDSATFGVFSGNDVMLVLLPMFHINPIGVWTFPIIFTGQTLCIRKAFSPADFWPAITENGVTILMGVPAMYNYVYYSIDPATIDRKNLKLKFAFCGAAPIAVDLIKGFKEKFGVDIIEGYGLTEGNGVSTLNPVLGKRKPGSIGLPLPGQEVKVMGDDLHELPRGEVGEICVRGECVMQEYFNKPEATRETIVDGWLKTGDVAYQDEDGYLYIVDRKKDMINRGGENIYPREIEIEIETHPKIVAVAVVGYPDEALGERVKAVIEITAPGAVDGEEIKDYLKDRLAKYKIPEWIEIVGALPRNPTGKVLKHALRQQTKD